MKIEFWESVKAEKDVSHIECVLPVRYDEEDIPNDFPGRDGDTLTLLLNIDAGTVENWPAGHSAEFCMKVVDGGNYYLLNGDSVVAKLEGEYVPKCIPGEYGDYVEMTIDEFGNVSRAGRYWKPSVDDILTSFKLHDSDDRG